MSTITVVLDSQHIDFVITHHSSCLPATYFHPEEPEELEWRAKDPAIQALVEHFGLHEAVEELIVEQAKKDRTDADLDAAAIYSEAI